MKKRSKSKIASIYAIALYEAAVEKKALVKIQKDVALLLAETKALPDFVKFFANPIIEIQDKKDTLKQIAGKLKLNPETLSCLDILAENGRFSEFELILEEFVHYANKQAGIAEVQVKAVKELNPVQSRKLESALEKMLNQKVLVNYEVCPEILGGLQIKFGSNMIDDTILAKLNRLEQIMKGGQ